MIPGLFAELRKNVSQENKQFLKKALDISLQVREILEIKEISQNEFATMLGKKPSEVSRWLSGLHNLTLESIVKMETVLECDIIATPKEICKNYPTYDKFKQLVFGANSTKKAVHKTAFSIKSSENFALEYA